MTANSVSASNNVSGVVYYDRISNLSSKKSYTKSFAEVQNHEDVYKLAVSPEAKRVYELVAKNAHGLRSQLRPPYFRDYYEYNNNLAMEEAKRVVELAKKDGIELDVNMVYEDVRKWNAIEDEPPAATYVNNEGMQGLNPWKLLTDEEKAVFEQMHEYALKNGIPIEQVTMLARFHAMQKEMNSLSNKSQPTVGEYVSEFIDRIKYENKIKPGNYKAPDIGVLETFLKNIKIFEENAKRSLIEKSDKKV